MGPIHAQHYHFDCFDAVFGLDWMRGEGWQGSRGRKPSQHCTALFRITLLMTFCCPPRQNATFSGAHVSGPPSPAFPSN